MTMQIAKERERLEQDGLRGVELIAEEIAREQQVAPLSYTRFSAPGVGGEGGAGNYWVPIYKRKSDNAPYLIIWFFDSRGGVTPQNKPAAD
ncbi:hypothetical protein Agabi119p4_9679 [Agaricus bisporus var. burnettii]|uniref:Uncharacterized protein n=1 Tax=Agaricus bisporus var. burnettii TaxID=192524 RepID=A0A8H7C3A7_AGABI|nr:hypothetical protein Agabi119p4_9679 [Agaricus bisporus var. burnettii]